MLSSWARRGCDGRASFRVALVASGALALTAPAVQAVPIDDPNLGGIGFSGPTTGDLAAVYWNPAALGLMHGPQLMVSSTLSLTTTTVQRASIDPTGQPGSGPAFPAARASGSSHPFSWPPGPGAFLGIGSDVGGDRFALAVAAFLPFAERATFDDANNPALPTRYHRISADLRNLALVPALAVRFSGDLRLGFAPGFLLSTGHLSFDETTCSLGGHPACAVPEDPAADARYDISSSSGFSSAKFAFTLGGGLYYRRRAWEMGLAFSSRPFGGSGAAPVGIAGNESQLTLPPRDGGGPVTCMNGRADGRGCVFADLSYKLPYTITGGVTWHPRAGAELALIVRYLSFGSNDVIDIRIARAPAPGDGLPEHIVLHRGYDSLLDTRVRFAQWLGERLRIGAGLRVETSALPASEVSPAAVDGLKVQPTAMVMYRPLKHLSLVAGYGFTYMFDVTAAPGSFNSSAASTCEEAAGDLKACETRLAGLARPTAAGTYGMYRHDFSLSVTTQF
jgi:Outer membrane protein transport protein (OMPP1/FadL/TodX)